MAKANQIKALVESHAECDDRRFYAIAMQVAAQAARKGQTNFAKELKTLITESKQKQPSFERESGKVSVLKPQGELASLLHVSFPKTKLASMILSTEIHTRLSRVIKEQRQRRRLEEFGLRARNKLLLIGPPGTGKTMTASALAGEMGLPLFTIRLEGLITRFLGETAAKLRLIFDQIERTRAVYLFDEFDALGSHRNSSNDVGEIRRVLNSFLQFLEQEKSDSLIVGATNYSELLDKALFRRFDDIIEYPLPPKSLVKQAMQNRLAILDTSQLDWNAVVSSAEGLSFAEIVKACEDAAKTAILASTETIATETLRDALAERRTTHR